MPRRISASRSAHPSAAGPGEVEVEVEAGGICGSDLHYFNHGGFGTVRLREPMILGHEVAGRVVDLGEGVDGLAVGDRVAVSPSRPCGAQRPRASAVVDPAMAQQEREQLLAFAA